MSHITSLFSKIYKNVEWNDSFSGPGSTEESTIEYRKFIENIIIELEIRSILDVGCGYWTFSSKIDWKNCSYTGIDVVPFVIEYNKQFSNHSRQFIFCEIDDIKILNYDLIICKDVLQHLSYDTSIKILNKMIQCKWMVITNDTTETNIDCKDGEWRPINIEIYPFNFRSVKKLNFQSNPNNKTSCLIRGACEPKYYKLYPELK